jgi:adenylate cyclase
LLPVPQPARERSRRRVYAEGGEREIVVLFADLRDFTRLVETRLPYDTVFIVNRYFQAMGQAVEAAGGHVDKFVGDGVMVLFGLDADSTRAAGQALTAARLMSGRLEELNRALVEDLDAPLRMGIGIHVGSAIIGEMGYGRTRSLTAVGDMVNVASRLESLSKSYACELVVSEDLLRTLGLDLPMALRREVEIRGRATPMAIYTLATARDLPETVVPASTRPVIASAARHGRPDAVLEAGVLRTGTYGEGS